MAHECPALGIHAVNGNDINPAASGAAGVAPTQDERFEAHNTAPKRELFLGNAIPLNPDPNQLGV